MFWLIETERECETVNKDERRVVPVLSKHILDEAAVESGVRQRCLSDSERGAAVCRVYVDSLLSQRHNHIQLVINDSLYIA